MVRFRSLVLVQDHSHHCHFRKDEIFKIGSLTNTPKLASIIGGKNMLTNFVSGRQYKFIKYNISKHFSISQTSLIGQTYSQTPLRFMESGAPLFSSCVFLYKLK